MIVVVVFMMSCHVLLKLNMGPDTSHSAMKRHATENAHGDPTMWPVFWAIFRNTLVREYCFEFPFGVCKDVGMFIRIIPQYVAYIHLR